MCEKGSYSMMTIWINLIADIKDKSNNTMANAINGEAEEGEKQGANEAEEMEEGTKWSHFNHFSHTLYLYVLL